jgi:hypothetical protein
MDSSKAKRREDRHPMGQNVDHGTDTKNKKRIFAEMAAIR